VRVSDSDAETFLGCLVRVRDGVACSDFWVGRPLLVVHERLAVGELSVATLPAGDDVRDEEQGRRAATFWAYELDLVEGL
jgi:hypothetical protein